MVHLTAHASAFSGVKRTTVSAPPHDVSMFLSYFLVTRRLIQRSIQSWFVSQLVPLRLQSVYFVSPRARRASFFEDATDECGFGKRLPRVGELSTETVVLD